MNLESVLIHSTIFKPASLINVLNITDCLEKVLNFYSLTNKSEKDSILLCPLFIVMEEMKRFINLVLILNYCNKAEVNEINSI